MAKAVSTQLVELEELQKHLTKDFTTLDPGEIEVLRTVDMLIDDCLTSRASETADSLS